MLRGTVQHGVGGATFIDNEPKGSRVYGGFDPEGHGHGGGGAKGYAGLSTPLDDSGALATWTQVTSIMICVDLVALLWSLIFLPSSGYYIAFVLLVCLGAFAYALSLARCAARSWNAPCIFVES
jgi:hypothetical protein